LFASFYEVSVSSHPERGKERTYDNFLFGREPE
jgi:hypothetical protein